MRISAYLANPGGNITLLVLDATPIEARADLAKRLMALPDLAIEQVGYVTTPVCCGDTRLEMMGGELCGNASRSLGYLEGCLRGKRARSLEWNAAAFRNRLWLSWTMSGRLPLSGWHLRLR